MRKISPVKNNHPTIKQVMIYESEDGVYVFPFISLEDGTATGEECYQFLSDAEAVCKTEYGIGASDWIRIDDPLKGCQHDWIAPVRIKGRDIGKPEWGHLEKLEDGIWKEFTTNK